MGHTTSLRWSQNHEPHRGRHQTWGMLAFHITQAALDAWPTDTPITKRDIEIIRTEAEYTAQTIYLREYGNA